jgi:rhomboid family GlyGly-CTERM serine protease
MDLLEVAESYQNRGDRNAHPGGNWATCFVRALHLDSGRWRIPLLLLALVVALSCFGDSATLALRYQRSAIAAGEWWRLISAHVVHLGWPHMLMNAAGLLLVWALFGDEFSDVDWCLLSLASALAISVSLWWLSRDVEWYVGLSGVLHAQMAAGCCARLRSRQWDGAALALFLIGKLSYEQLHGGSPLSMPLLRSAVVVDAHLYGALAGAAIAILLLARCRYNRRSTRGV